MILFNVVFFRLNQLKPCIRKEGPIQVLVNEHPLMNQIRLIHGGIWQAGSASSEWRQWFLFTHSEELTQAEFDLFNESMSSSLARMDSRH